MTDSRVPDLSNVKSPSSRPNLDYKMVKDGNIIGSGGQAIVRRVSLDGPESPDTVAIKEPQAPSETLGRETLQSFFEEAKIWEKLARHERERQIYDDYIVGVVAIGDDLPWLAMEYMDCGSLADRLDSHPDGLPVDEAVWIAECLCKGLKPAHKNGVAHLDLKPANVLFRETPNDTWNVPKIADWGIARTLLDESNSMEAYSPQYAAPEQLDSTEFGRPDTYTDLYQIGMILYEMLTGRLPYTGGQASIKHDVISDYEPDPPSTQRNAVPKAVDEVVMQLISTDKSQRYRGSIDLLENALQNIRTSKPASAAKTDQHTAPVSGDSTLSGQQSRKWPMFQGGPTRTGHALHTTAPTDRVTERWAFETGERVYSSPTVVDGTVYVGSHDNNVYALDAETGDKKWLFKTEGCVMSSPAVVDGTVYFGSFDNHVYALDAETGDKQWQFDMGGRDSRRGAPQISSSPAVVGGTAFIGGKYNYVYALDAETGEQKWRFDVERVTSSPAVVGGTVYVGCVDNNVYALDAATGNRQWSFETEGWVKSSPAVVGGTAYVGSSDNRIYALDANTGDQQWYFEADGFIISSPAIAEDLVYVGSSDNFVYALDTQSGHLQWDFDTGRKVKSSPVVADGTVYVGVRGRHGVYALDATSGDKQWDFGTFSVISSPAVVEDTVYVGSSDNFVYALE